MTKKRTAPRKRTSKSKAKKPAGRRFLRTLVLSAVASFSVASCVLNPQLRDQIPLEPILSQLRLPEQGQIAAPVAPTGAPAQTRFVHCPQFFPDGKTPIVPSGPALRELCFSSFAILHSGQTKTPVFVAQRVNRRMLAAGQGVMRTDRFYEEVRLPQAESATLADYRGSGFDRGHMAPAGDMKNDEAMVQSFSLANMVPQDAQHNRGAWSKIEADTRKYVMRAAGDVYVFTGPAYSAHPATIGVGRVAVPSYLYKMVFDSTTGHSWVHWHANSADAKVGPPIGYDEFVRRTGLQLLVSRQ